MTAITNYTTLVQAIQDAAEDDGDEFVGYIPTAVDLAEERLFKELDLMDLEIKDTGNLVVNTPTISKPQGYEFGHDFKITNTLGNKVILKRRTESFINDYWPNSAAAGTPKYYCDLSATQLLLAPTPDIAYTYELKYTKQPTKLSDSNATNYLVEQCKDALYFACMAEMTKFMKSWSQVDRWNTDFNNARDAWNIQAQRKRRDNGERPMNPDGGDNTLKHTIGSNA